MARKPKIPRTPALRILDAAKVAYTVHQYDYVERGGTAASSAALGVDEHSVVKTLIFETEARAPVVVCQHGLEGLPEHVIDEDEKGRPWRAYKAFAAKLAERGFITFAPHNPYRGYDKFRVLQRKLNPLGKTLFSVILAQHDRILDWLSDQPFVDPERIVWTISSLVVGGEVMPVGHSVILTRAAPQPAVSSK